MSYNLFLDDDEDRIPHNLAWIDLPLVDWEIVRSYNAFVKTIKRKGLPLRVSFDHDLADEHYKSLINGPIVEGDFRLNTGFKIPYQSFKEKTGYHACKWLIEYCLDKKLPLPECFIHTQNPIGRQNIQSLIDSYRKVCENKDV